MKKILWFFLLFFLLFLFTPQKTLAAQLSTSGIPTTIDQSQDFVVNINLSCSGCGDSYLRGVFYPNGSKYFGYTQDNAGNWSNASSINCTTFFKVAKADLSSDGNWSGSVRFKADKDNSNYSGPGNYFFKVGRYTPSCTSPSVWSTEMAVAITSLTPTPTQSPSPTPAPTSTPSPTPKPATPKPTISSTVTATPKATTVSVSLTKELSSSRSSRDILGTESSQPSIKPTDKPQPIKTLGAKENNTSKILIALGVIIILSGAGIYIKSMIKKEE